MFGLDVTVVGAKTIFYFSVFVSPTSGNDVFFIGCKELYSILLFGFVGVKDCTVFHSLFLFT